MAKGKQGPEDFAQNAFRVFQQAIGEGGADDGRTGEEPRRRRAGPVRGLEGRQGAGGKPDEGAAFRDRSERRQGAVGEEGRRLIAVGEGWPNQRTDS